MFNYLVIKEKIDIKNVEDLNILSDEIENVFEGKSFKILDIKKKVIEHIENQKKTQQPEKSEPTVEKFEEKKAINPEKFKKEKQQIQSKQKEQSFFKYTEDKTSIYIEETIKQKLKQNEIKDRDIEIIEKFIRSIYKPNEDNSRLNNIIKNGFKEDNYLNLDKDKIEKINECLGFKKIGENLKSFI